MIVLYILYALIIAAAVVIFPLRARADKKVMKEIARLSSSYRDSLLLLIDKIERGKLAFSEPKGKERCFKERCSDEYLRKYCENLLVIVPQSRRGQLLFGQDLLLEKHPESDAYRLVLVHDSLCSFKTERLSHIASYDILQPSKAEFDVWEIADECPQHRKNLFDKLLAPA